MMSPCLWIMSTEPPLARQAEAKNTKCGNGSCQFADILTADLTWTSTVRAAPLETAATWGPKCQCGFVRRIFIEDSSNTSSFLGIGHYHMWKHRGGIVHSRLVRGRTEHYGPLITCTLAYCFQEYTINQPASLPRSDASHNSDSEDRRRRAACGSACATRVRAPLFEAEGEQPATPGD